MRLKLFIPFILLIFICASNALGASKQQDLKDEMFSNLKEKMEAAKLKKADILSPVSFSKAEKAFQEAVATYKSDKRVEVLKESVNEVNELLNKTDENVELSKLTLGKLIAARQEAIVARAQQYALDSFKQGEKYFLDAARQVEKGNVNRARKYAERAEPYFKKAQAKAIREGLLGDVKKLREQAREKDVEDYCPSTLRQAEKKFNEAKRLIDSGDYKIETAKKKVDEARFAYEHSMALSEKIRSARKKKKKYEDVFIGFENKLAEISDALGVEKRFDKGMDYQLKNIIGAIERNRKNREDLDQRLSNKTIELENRVAQYNAQSMEKDKEIAMLKGKKAEEAERLNVLKQKLEKENLKKEKYKRIKSLFSLNEAKVYKDSTDIVVQLFGLTFPSGKSTIEVDNFDLLAKVQKSIREFPQAKVIVEGHTDSVGDQKFNEILSDERAKAVMKYLVVNKTIDDKDISAVGFGDSKPVASNNTKEGRARNRRIDIIIKTR